MLKHPLSYMRFLSYLNLSAGTLLKRYFKDPIFSAFLTSSQAPTAIPRWMSLRLCWQR